MKSAAAWLVGHARLVLLIHLLLTIFLAAFAWRLRIEGSLQSVLPAGDPAVQFYADVRATFGSDDVAVVGVLADDLFSAPTLSKIARVTDALARLEGVERVLSLTNAVDYAADVFDPPPLLPGIPLKQADVAMLRQKIASTPLYANNFVSHDFRGAAINVFFTDLTDAEYGDLGIDEKIQALLAVERGPEQLFYTGAAHVKQAAVSLMRRDLFRFTPVALAFAIVVLWLAFRSLRGVLLPVVSVLEATICTLGVMVLLGKSITLGTFILPPLLLVIGTSYGIHVMARYDELHGSGTGPDSLVVETVDQVWLPLVISALTTVIGFGALLLNRITAIWDLGLFSVIGLVFLSITCLTLLPAALQVLGPRTGGTRPVDAQSPRLSRALSLLAARSYSSRYLVLVAATALGLVVALGMRYIRVDSDFLAYFEPDSSVRQANETINQRIVGSNPFYLVVEGGKRDTLKRWEVLKQLKDLQGFLHTLPGVTSSISIVDYLELLESGLNKEGEDDLIVDEQGRIIEPPAAKTFWEEPSKLEGVLSLLATAPNAFRGAVTADFSRGTILVRTKLSGSKIIEQTLDRIREYIAQHFPAGLSVTPTGNLVLLTGTSSDIVAGQINSLSLALVVIFVIMSLMFLSVRVGLLAILPNVLPLVIFFGVLGWLGIDFNLGTSLIATIALGIAVDSTIHYMARLSREVEGEIDQAAAMRRTLQKVGLPIIYTTLALLFGFLTFIGSSFVPIQSFGLMTAVTLATALAANLLVLPALLAATKIITLWDLLSVRLGRDPGRTIPMLAGLRPAQSRIVVLMGEMRKFGAGEAIVRRGELGEDMFVIIQGNVRVWAGEGSERRCVSELGRGDVFGEMGLVRHNERSADVIAADEVEVLAVNERFLDRIQRRYPRIASKVFLNLTRILSDRLERMTNQLVRLR
jgi:hypothetical protein